ncbi:cellulose-binding domain-containing protein [Actinoplanes sp. NPDC048791]|uniref:cellulose-binding domain-containing protein n=1 Tax=Actinoplanes sp. NPDC048791 TaxID=3154623 RepID=UPI0033FCA66E
MAPGRTRRLLAVALAVGLGATLSVMTMTAHAAAAGCQVSYTVGSQWQGGFGASVAVTNLGDPINGWTLRWSFGAGQTVGQAWNATVTQSGAAVTAAGMSYNAALATGASASFGFNGTWTGSNPVPTGFTLNNVACTGSTTTTPPTTPSTTGPTTTPPTGTPPARTVRVYWLKPTDKAFDQRYPDGITSVMQEAQRFFKAQLGKTFTLNNPVVEVVNGLHDTNWYITNNCTGSDHYWCVVENGQRELQQRFGADSRWINVEEVSAEEPNRSGGGGGNGWVLLSGHDADGAAGVNGPINRWYGGMVHELGHAFGLPDATSTDGTCMSASLYDYPNCTFSQSQKNGILNGPFASFLS